MAVATVPQCCGYCVRDNNAMAIVSSSTDDGVVQNGGSTFAYRLAITLEVFWVIARMMFSYVTAIWSLFFPPTQQSVAGEIVLITGTGHGIGKELAKKYGELGATVVCCDINEETNNATVESLKKSGVQAYGYKCDISNRDDVLSLKNKIVKDVGKVSILVNNAGIMPCKPLQQQTPEIIKKQFDINVFAHFWTVEAFVPDMVAAKKGHVVALSSVAGLSGNPNLVPYCATKFAVRGMMEAMSEEHRRSGSPVKFTTIYPYMVDTGLCQRPRIRFPEVFKMLTIDETAEAIIKAQRTCTDETSIPPYLLHLNNNIRAMPRQAAKVFIDFFDSWLDPHD